VRKWTKSALLVLAWGIILPLLAAVGSRGTDQPAQASITIARSSTQAALPAAAGGTITLTAVTATTVTATAAPAATTPPAATWTVRPGDTLSGIATALAVPGGWPALYAANRRAIGPDPDILYPGTILRLPEAERPARYSVVPGDTLSAIAAALAVPGGWQALYAANRAVVGSDPGLIRPGTVLTLPRPPAGQHGPTTGQQAPQGAAPIPAVPGHQAPSTATAGGRTPHPRITVPGSAVPAGAATSGGGTGSSAAAGVMPRWLKEVLLTAGLLVVIAFTIEPVLAIGRRRAARATRSHGPAGEPGSTQDAVEKARIIFADHERLIVTYGVSDHTVYVLTPPGEDPRAVLRAARLILPEDAYEELAGHLGIPSAWPLE